MPDTSDKSILGKTMDKGTITWTTTGGTSHTVRASSIMRGSLPAASDGKHVAYLPPEGPGKPPIEPRPWTGPSIEGTTPAEACKPDATHPAATISNLVRSGASFELICTYPASGAQWWITHTSGESGVSAGPINTPGKLLPAIAKSAVSLDDLGTGGPSNAHLVSSGWGRAGAGVTSVTLITQAGEKIPAKLQNGFWTVIWQSGSNPMDTRYATLTWKTADGTTYTSAGDKVSGTNGLKVPPGTATTGATAIK